MSVIIKELSRKKSEQGKHLLETMQYNIKTGKYNFSYWAILNKYQISLALVTVLLLCYFHCLLIASQGIRLRALHSKQ